MLPTWEKLTAALAGEEAVKALGEKILPRPNPLDTSDDNTSRYIAYQTRAVWYNVTQRTLSGMAGYVFQKEPTVNLPAELQPLETNVDGSGVTLLQQAKATLRLVLGKGRCGILVDYPVTSEPVTKADINAGNVAPTFVLYEPETIINWKTSHVGAKTFLDLLVLKEAYVEASTDNEFEMSVYTQYRVLSRTPEGVTGRIFQADDETGEYVSNEDKTYAPKDKAGNPLKEIPFCFVGSVNNDACVDHAPLADLANLNFAHFRNSADYEEACFLVGQPTPWVSGLTTSWVKDTLKGTVHIGSRAILPLPVGGQAGLLQANPNTLPMEAMLHKEQQMIALGAQLVQQKDVQRTATEAGLDHSSEVSTLTAAANNVFLAFKQAFGFAGLFVGTDTASLEFELSEPLTQDTLDPQEATALMAMWQANLIDFEEARTVLKASGTAYLKDDVVKARAEANDLNFPPARPTVPPTPPKPVPAPPKPRPALK